MAVSAAIVYVTNLSDDTGNVADLFDLAYLFKSASHRVRAICTTATNGDGLIDRIATLAQPDAHFATLLHTNHSRLAELLETLAEPINLVVVGGYQVVAELIRHHRETVRRSVLRLFLVGGHVNTYSDADVQNLPINPRLREQFPEYYSATSLSFQADDAAAFAQILLSGEAVIWLPRDIALWRYAAPELLRDGGTLTEILRQELVLHTVTRFQEKAGRVLNRAELRTAGRMPVLLSTLPAFLLAVQPDATFWLAPLSRYSRIGRNGFRCPRHAI